ncbi:hypothetical protein Tco_0675905 [Tanacetum coccineum]
MGYLFGINDAIKVMSFDVIMYAPSIIDDEDDRSIQIYSLETGVWSVRSVGSDQFMPKDFSSFRQRIYWNDVIHWIDHAYIYKQPPLNYKLDIVNEHLVLTIIQFPVITSGNEEAGFRIQHQGFVAVFGLLFWETKKRILVWYDIRSLYCPVTTYLPILLRLTLPFHNVLKTKVHGIEEKDVAYVEVC